MADNALYVVDDDLVLDADWFNRLLGDVHTRIRAIEGIKANLEAAIGDLTEVGLKRIDDVLVPVIQQAQDDVETLIQQAQADVAAVQQNLAEVSALIAQLLAGGVPAANVVQNASRVFVTPAEKAQIQATADALTLAVSTLNTSINGLNTAKAPKDSPDFSGAVAFTSVISPAALTADQNDYNPANLAAVMTVRLQAAQQLNITGLKAGRSGEFKLIDNVGAGDLVLVSEAAASVAANRFALGGDTTLKAGQSLMLRYDATSSRWRAVANVIRQTTPVGLRAQIDVAPPLPWLALNGGAFNNAAYPLLAQKFGVDAGLTGTPSAITWSTASIGVDLSFTNIGLAKGLGFYWALFWRAESGTNFHTLRCYKAVDPLGAWTLVFSEADVTNGQATVQLGTFEGNLSPGQIEFAEGLGVFSFGNTLVVLEATTYTIRRNFFSGGTWNANYSKLACFNSGMGYWVFADRSPNPALGWVTGPKTGAVGYGGTVSGWGLVAPKRLIYWKGSTWLLNGSNEEAGSVFRSGAGGYDQWTTIIGQDSNRSAKALFVAGGALYATFSAGTNRGFHKSTDGLSFAKTETSNSATACVGLDTAQGSYIFAVEGNVAYYYNRASVKAQIATAVRADYQLSLVYDEVNGGLITSNGSQRLYATLNANPLTQSLLPAVASSPTTYIFGG